MNENKLKHLEFIQNVVTRINTNSFQIKSLSITVVSAFLGVYASNKNLEFIIIAIVPCFLFWSLDTYYLQLERKFRKLYEDVSGVSEKPIVTKLFEMSPHKYKGGQLRFISVFFSATIWPLYSSMIFGLIIFYKYLSYSNG